MNKELSENKVKLVEYLIQKLNTIDTISFLHSGEFNINKPLLDNKLFKEKKIKIEIKLGILPFVDLLNKKNELITNRSKNSSVTFFNYLDRKKIFFYFRK